MKHIAILVACIGMIFVAGCHIHHYPEDQRGPSHRHQHDFNRNRDFNRDNFNKDRDINIQIDRRGTCDARHHCGCYSCNICRLNRWFVCRAGDCCGHCSICRANGWSKHINIQIDRHHIDIRNQQNRNCR